MIPHDIHTCWNATYNMLDFAYQYKKAINKITDIQDIKLCLYEIEAHEWEIVWQLCDMLKVSKFFLGSYVGSSLFPRFSRMRHCSSHMGAHQT